MMVIMGNSQVPVKSNADVVSQLNKVSIKLKIMWKQKIKDSKIYTKMQSYQEELTSAYETSEFLKQTSSILELIELIEVYGCRVRRIHEFVNSPNLQIPSGCGFSYKYQKSITAFNMSMDFVELIMGDVSMTIKDRMEKLQESKEKIIEAEEEISVLTNKIISYNV